MCYAVAEHTGGKEGTEVAYQREPKTIGRLPTTVLCASNQSIIFGKA